MLIVRSQAIRTHTEGHFKTEQVHMAGKRFKKWAGFLPNVHQKKFGKKIAGYFYRFSVFPLPARYVPVMQKTKMRRCIHEIPIGYGQDSWKQRSVHRNGSLGEYHKVRTR